MQTEQRPPSGGRKKFLLAAVVITSIIYIGWRIFFTIPFKHGLVSVFFGIMLVGAETVAVLEAFSHYWSMHKSRSPEKPDIPPEMYPHVDVLVATHSEEAELLYKTLNGCLHLKYPDKSKVHIYLCDDMNRPEMRELAEKMGVGYFGLANNKEAKAGNLNNALSLTDSPLVATLDSDMIPTSEFLLETVPYFALPLMIKEDGRWRRRTPAEIDEKEKIGFIQTPQSFYNADLFQFNLYADKNVPNEQDYFFREVNVGRNSTNSVVYAGSNTVISRQALEEVGGIRTGTITEDFATGLDVQAAGYTTFAIDTVVAHGLAPKDFKSLIKQRQRWARGCVQVLCSGKFLFGPLPLPTKLSYMVCFLYWWTFLRRLVYILSPILFVMFGIVVVDCSLWELLLIWLPSYLIYNQTLRVMSGNIRNVRWSNVVDTVMFPYLVVPVIAETFGFRMKKFAVTPKIKSSARNSEFKYAVPHILLAIPSVVGIAFCLYDFVVNKSYGGVIIFYWLVMNLYTLLNAILLIAGRINYRNDERFYAQVPVVIKVGRLDIRGETADLSENGLAVLLDYPEYLPNEKSFQVQLRHKEYIAHVKAKCRHVVQVGEKWKYSLQITDCSEEDRRQYLQIVFDRSHSLPKFITSGLVEDTATAVKGVVSRQLLSNRKLPRIEMNAILPTADGGEVEILNYNYEYILLKNSPSLKIVTDILLGDEIRLHAIRHGEMEGGSGILYRIENWERVSLEAAFREQLKALLDHQSVEPDEGLQEAPAA